MEPSKIRVLYVDDEANNLISFKANFRQFYEVYTADSAKEGKKILDEREIHILITDQRMPVQNGVQFLESIIKDHPSVIRIILTGYADLDTVIEAINKGQIYKYILKPFDADELKSSIDSAYDLYEFRRRGERALLKFRQLFENHNDTIFIMDKEGFLQEMNNFGLNLFKIQRSDLSKTTLVALIDSPDEYFKMDKKLNNEGILIDYPIKLNDTKQNRIDALISIVPINDFDNIIGYQGMVRDITRQKEMESLLVRAIIETQENERIRLGKNLHDSIGQKLSAVLLFIQELQSNESFKNNKVLDKCREVIDHSMVDLKNICFNIMPKTLEVLGLGGAIKELKRQNEADGLLAVNASVDKDLPKLNLHLEIAIFRIIQEALSNSVSHGKAKQVDWILKYKSGQLEIVLKDNGKGFNVKNETLGSGMGLKNIQSRVQSYNGEIKINSTNKGTEINILIPIKESLLG